MTDPRPMIVQFPFLSDDSETVKAQAVPTQNEPVQVSYPGALGIPVKIFSK